jgi:regulator of sigma E protease
MSILIAIFAVGLLIALHEVGHFAIARSMGMKVTRFSIGFFKTLWSWQSKKSGTTYQIGALPLGGFVQIRGMNPFEEDAETDPDAYLNKPVWRRALVLLAGPTANLVIAWLVLFLLYSTTGNPQYVDRSGVGILVPDSPADKAGLESGDEILSLNGETLNTWDDLTSRLRTHPDQPVQLEVKREGTTFLVEVTPLSSNGVGKIGIGQPQEVVSLPVHIAAVGAAVKCYQVVVGSISSLVQLVTGETSDVQAVGPVGIVKMAANTLDTGFKEFLALVSYLSLMLFVFNLLPLPALDGGRGALLLYEAVARRRVSPKFDVIVNSAGFFLLIGLLLFMTVRDIFFG